MTTTLVLIMMMMVMMMVAVVMKVVKLMMCIRWKGIVETQLTGFMVRSNNTATRVAGGSATSAVL